MPPLPPVTSARFMMVNPGFRRLQQRGIQHHNRAPAQQQFLSGKHAEAIQNRIVVARLTLGFHAQIRGDVIQTRHAQFNRAHAGQVTSTRRAVGSSQQCAVGRHRLRGVFNAAGRAQAAVRAQRIIQ